MSRIPAYMFPIVFTEQATPVVKKVFEKIINDLPNSQKEMINWLRDQRGYENYLEGIDNQFMATPAVASTTFLLPHEDGMFRSRYMTGEESV